MWNVMTTTEIYQRNIQLRTDAKSICSQLDDLGIDYHYDDDRIVIYVDGRKYYPYEWEDLVNRLLKERDDENDSWYV